MSDPDVCVHCGASGCLSNVAQHGPTCPFATGMWPIEQGDVDRGARCAACDEPFALGDLTYGVEDMAHHAVTGALPLAEAMNADAVTFTICLGCAALGKELQ